MRILFFIFTFLFLTTSCQNDINHQGTDDLGPARYSIEMSPSEDEVDWNALVDSVSVIPLENKLEALLGKIDKIEIKGDSLFLLDVMHRKLNIFDLSTGKFLAQIGSRGKGPGEFLDMRDFTIVNDTLYCLDYNKVNKYNVNSFEFISTTNFTSQETAQINPMNFIYFGDSKYYIWNNLERGEAKDEQGYFLLEYTNNKRTNSYLKHNGARSFEDKMFFNTSDPKEFFVAPPVGFNNISLVTGSEIINYIEIDFDGKNIPINYLETIQADEDYFNLLLANNYYKVVKNILDIDRNKLYVNLIGPQGFLYEALINLETKDYLFSTVSSEKNPLVAFYKDEYIYFYCDALKAIQLLKKDQTGKKSKFTKVLRDLNIEEEDNFIFFKAKLK